MGMVDVFLDFLVVVYSGDGLGEVLYFIYCLRLMEFFRDM